LRVSQSALLQTFTIQGAYNLKTTDPNLCLTHKSGSLVN
jgi:hypothetical protein